MSLVNPKEAGGTECVSMSYSFGPWADGRWIFRWLTIPRAGLRLSDLLTLFTHEVWKQKAPSGSAGWLLPRSCFLSVTGAKMKEAFFVLLEGAGSGERCVLSSQAENAKLLEVSATQGLLCNFPRQDPPAFLGKPPRMSLHSAGTRCGQSP